MTTDPDSADDRSGASVRGRPVDGPGADADPRPPDAPDAGARNADSGSADTRREGPVPDRVGPWEALRVGLAGLGAALAVASLGTLGLPRVSTAGGVDPATGTAAAAPFGGQAPLALTVLGGVACVAGITAVLAALLVPGRGGPLPTAAIDRGHRTLALAGLGAVGAATALLAAAVGTADYPTVDAVLPGWLLLEAVAVLGWLPAVGALRGPLAGASPAVARAAAVLGAVRRRLAWPVGARRRALAVKLGLVGVGAACLAVLGAATLGDLELWRLPGWAAVTLVVAGPPTLAAGLAVPVPRAAGGTGDRPTAGGGRSPTASVPIPGNGLRPGQRTLVGVGAFVATVWFALSWRAYLDTRWLFRHTPARAFAGLEAGFPLFDLRLVVLPVPLSFPEAGIVGYAVVGAALCWRAGDLLHAAYRRLRQ